MGRRAPTSDSRRHAGARTHRQYGDGPLSLMPGHLIVFEGLDQSGKQTQAERLRDRLILQQSGEKLDANLRRLEVIELEQATSGKGAGAWLKLAWTSPVVISRIVLYDRPNSNDQITTFEIILAGCKNRYKRVLLLLNGER